MGEIDPGFDLWDKLAANKHHVLDLEVSRVLLFDDTSYPCWLVLVPMMDGLGHMHDLPEAHQLTLMKEINKCSKVLQDEWKTPKMNVAAIGNMCQVGLAPPPPPPSPPQVEPREDRRLTPPQQLHIHITCRHEKDPTWPGPCYGGALKKFEPEALEAMLAKLRGLLK